MRTYRRWIVTALVVFVGISLGTLTLLTAQGPYKTLGEIANMVYDRTTNSINLSDTAVAQGPQLSVAEIANLVVTTGVNGAYIRTTGGITTVDNLPGTCALTDAPRILPNAEICLCSEPSPAVYVCNSPAAGTGGDIPGANTVGPSQLIALGTPGECGDATHSCQITFDADGRESAQTEVLIVPDAGTITAPMLADTTVTPGTFGSPTSVPVLTTTQKGQLTAVVNTPIVGLAPTVGTLPAEPCTSGNKVVLTTDNRLYLCAATLTWETAAGQGGTPGPDSVGPLELQPTAITPGTCGSGTQSCVITWDQEGRGTAQSNTPITALPGTNTVTEAMLQDTTVVAGTYGSATSVPVLTTQSKGQLTAVVNTPIPGLVPTVDALPAEPCTEDDKVVLTTDRMGYICQLFETDLLWTPIGSPGGTTINGILTTTAGVLSQHWVVTPLSGVQDLGVGNGMVAVTVGTLGATFRLPDPAALDAPSHITLIIVDEGTGYLTVLPYGAENIGEAGNLSPVPITGKGSMYEFRLIDSNNWHLVTSTQILPGELGGQTLCVGSAGSVDNAATNPATKFVHSLSCVIPAAAQLKEGTVLNACVMYGLIVGSVQPSTVQLGMDIGGVTIAETGGGTVAANVPERTTTHCYMIVLGADPTATTPTYTAPYDAGIFGLDDLSNANQKAQPVIANLSVDATLTFWSLFGSAGTGPTTLTQRAAWITIFKR